MNNYGDKAGWFLIRIDIFPTYFHLKLSYLSFAATEQLFCTLQYNHSNCTCMEVLEVREMKDLNNFTEMLKYTGIKLLNLLCQISEKAST